MCVCVCVCVFKCVCVCVYVCVSITHNASHQEQYFFSPYIWEATDCDVVIPKFSLDWNCWGCSHSKCPRQSWSPLDNITGGSPIYHPTLWLQGRSGRTGIWHLSELGDHVLLTSCTHTHGNTHTWKQAHMWTHTHTHTHNHEHTHREIMTLHTHWWSRWKI